MNITLVSQLEAPPRAPLIELEDRWRIPGDIRPIRRITMARWLHHGDAPLEVSNEGSGAFHCIGLNLKCASLIFHHAGRKLLHGRVPAGVVQVTAPATRVSAVFQSAMDVLHLFVPQHALAECYDDLFHRPHAGDIVLGDPKLIRDPALERLVQALAVCKTEGAALGGMFIESVSLAIVSRLVARHFTAPVARSREPSALPQWRIDRVSEFVDAHLAENIRLADIASSTGLTRMHFAAQFRRATGMRPHEYLLQKRIERAQALLRTSGHSMLDVALCCGFRSQAHFTTVFKRFVGATPKHWQTAMLDAA
ncbi:AraC family transcriptional regulator [Caballeronia novacaledonica]|uniref:AraC family transcriptional regulator n=1 Tax=Caballeronia novacaledonica TaxID=1544861 RepID=A0A2U3I0F1_9BURK|nr:AraC family transcriptional regulator [Caballeronia novacaledonica]SPB13575.1 AraC family transcriptional regulator [Caballeronia novacaledonica]